MWLIQIISQVLIITDLLNIKLKFMELIEC